MSDEAIALRISLRARAPGSSTSPPRRRSAAFAPAIRRGATSARDSPRPGRCPARPPRVHGVAIDVDDQEYAPIPGIWELREAIAGLYNRLYRRGMPSQYSAENVSVSGGGRAALTRAAASLGHVNLGHFLPDYTAYEELLDIFKAFTADPDPARGRARLRVLRRRSAPRGARARPGGAAAVEPVQPDRQARSAATSSRAGSRWRASSTARC